MLSGDLSAFISNIGESLQKLRVSFNAFEGTIPRNIDKFVKLREFWSARMNISGSIPDSLFDLKNLGKFSFFIGDQPDTPTLMFHLSKIP